MGTTRRLSEGVYQLRYDSAPDPLTGERHQRKRRFTGTPKQASDELKRLEAEALASGATGSGTETVGDYLERWLRDYAQPNTSPRTYDRYVEIVRRHLIPALGKVRLDQLRPLHLQRYYTEALKAGRLRDGGPLSARTVLHHHRVLSAALRQAVRWQVLARNPADGVSPPRVSKPDTRSLSPAEVAQLLDYARGRRFWIGVVLAVGTGLRMGELPALRWSDVDLDAGTLTVVRNLTLSKSRGLVFGPPKDKDQRTIHIDPFVVQALRDHKTQQDVQRALLEPDWKDHGLIICRADGSPENPKNYAWNFAWLARRSGLKPFRFHDLRHTHATVGIDAGVPLLSMSQRLGHSTIRITADLYVHKTPATDKEAARVTGERMWGERKSGTE